MRSISSIYETVRIKARRKYIQLSGNLRRKRINDGEFTIISNNCWGGFIYQSYKLKYNTPTIGLFIMAEDYIKFCSDLHKYIEKDIEMIDFHKSKHFDTLKDWKKFGLYPIGKLDDIEIHFLHEETEEQAKKDWERRKKRINYNRILYKFSEMNNCQKKDIIDFQKLELKNKICFISEQYKELANDYTFVIRRQKKGMRASREPFGKNKYFDMEKILNNL